MIAQVWKYHKLPVLFAVFSLVFYWTFAYDLVRSDFTKLLSLYAALFFFFYKIVQLGKTNFWLLAFIAIALRLVFLPAIPNLSQDFYRFIWDGRLSAQGINPYVHTVIHYLESGQETIVPQAEELFKGMGNANASHYTNYAPINQLCFFIAGWFSNTSILGAAIVFRIEIILADIGIIFFGKKLLEHLKIPSYHIFWYLLNPLVIIETVGNLHFEPVMIFFLVWALYQLKKGNWIWSAILFGLSISVKLIPLLFLPLVFQYFIKSNTATFTKIYQKSTESIPQSFFKRFLRLSIFYLVIILTILITFTPFLSETLINNQTETLGLYFKNFEFNGSLYYVIRWFGYQAVGWNIIQSTAKILPLIVIFITLCLTFFRKNNTLQQTITGMMLAMAIYFLFSTTVHPWYTTLLVFLSIFTNYRFPLVWSATIMLTYSAYGQVYGENFWLITLEYAVVFVVFFIDIFRFRKQPSEQQLTNY